MKFQNVFKNRVFIGSVLFTAFLYLYEEFLFGFPQFTFFQIVFIFRTFDEKLIVFLSGITSVTLCFWFVWLSLSIPRKFQIIPIFFVVLSSLIQYGFWKAVGRFMSSVDLQIAGATPLETWTGASALYFNWQFLVPIIGFIIILSIFSEQKQKSIVVKQSIFLFLSLIGVCYIYTFTNKTLSLGASLPSFYQTIVHFGFEKIQSSARIEVRFETSNNPSNNIVLIIDESIRGDHLSINGYSRDTTPFLRQLSQDDSIIRNWGLAVAGATCSHPSNALILTGVRPGIDDFESTQTYPTIFQYAKAMGYETYYLDAQTNSIWNGLNASDFEYIDVWIKASELGDDIQSDFRAADRIAEILTNSTGKFIVLNKRGVHFLYEGSYPPTYEIWSPIPTDYYSQPELVSNPYDNGIYYNVDAFFEHLLLDRSILQNTVILYTADHGQTLFEDNATWLHCNYTPIEATVPMLMIGKDLPIVKTENYITSHSNILPTLLDLMNVPPDKRKFTYAPSLFSSSLNSSNNHYFLDGGLNVIEFPK